MDPSHHQWRHRPLIAGTPCPICSIPHFPFCPPNPTSFQRPHLDPYSPPIATPPWQRNPNLGYHPFPPPHPPPPLQPPLPPPPPPYDHKPNGYLNESDRSLKRPRIDGFRGGFDPTNANNLTADERRLKLIHDHGGSSNQGFNANANQGFNVNVNNNVHHNVNYAVNSGAMPRMGGYFQPPLPVSPPPPLKAAPQPTLYPPSHGAHQHMMPRPTTPPYLHSKPFSHASTGYVTEFPKEAHVAHQELPRQYTGEGQLFPQKRLSLDKPKVVDALELFKKPHRVTRPDHFVIILRGLPGSGKSYLAKLLRDLEVENGGGAPRIHSMDDYFMTEVEKVEESDASKSTSSSRGKKPVVKKVMEYCYEPEMHEAYRSSMLKAFKKTLEDDIFTFVIVDDRNLRVAEFAQFWAIAKSSGYEVYILEAPYKDPVGCAARNVHGFSQEDIQKMAGQWEESPSIYLQLDGKPLFHGDDLKENGIQEVDMDTEDADNDVTSEEQERKSEKTMKPPTEDSMPDGSSKDVKSLGGEEEHLGAEVKELGRSKWSENLDEEETDKTEEVKGNALSGLIQAYHKELKSVSWSDEAGNTGFSITAAKKAHVSSLIIGPGAGYNMRSNPLTEAENPATPRSTAKPKRQNVFQDQLRAEHESFKAVFDRRRQRISGLDLEDE